MNIRYPIYEGVYRILTLNLPLLYQHNPQIFQKANIEPFGEECF